MTGRREFLIKTGAAAAGVAATGAANLREEIATQPPAAGPPSAASQPGASSPAPGTVRIPPPPGKEAYQARMEAARELLAAAKATALLEPPGSNMRYLTGLTVGRSERLVMLVLPARGEPILISPAFERDLMAAAPAGIQDIRVWEEDEDPYALLMKLLKKEDLSDQRVAIGSTTWYDEFAAIHASLPKLTFVTSSAVVGALRERKSPQEVALMETAIEITQGAIEMALKEARVGMREEDLSAIIASRIKEMGARGQGLVQFGPRSAVPHSPTSDRALAAGDMILIDYGAQVHGYWSDISRCAVMGRATGRMKLIHSAIRKAQDLALERAKPGVTGDAVDQIARAMLGGQGFSKLFVHRLGHGIGLDGHEPPYLAKGYYLKLSAGNTATLEPGVYTPGDYGIRIEDMMEVTSTGSRLMSKPPEALLEI